MQLIILAFVTISASQTTPKREARAAWVATVENLDWPQSRSQTSEVQQQDLVNLFDQLYHLGINVIIFQVRTVSDALYASPYEPWSYYLTGEQGRAPLPYYDPLELAVQEAHKRGMELHAWFNPYRAEVRIGQYPLAPNHVGVAHPEWTITIGTYRFMDPGKQVVRNHNLNVIMDVVRRYDIDGIHFDDYFYPYPSNEMTAAKPENDALDDATFAAEARGFTNKYDWRRDNVNLFFRQLYDSVQVTKPSVKVGVSPFGIWKNGVPAGISGLNAYSTLYCDAMAWLNDGSIDYLTPQLYWIIGGSQDYAKLMPWWADSVRSDNRHLYPGHAPYRIDAAPPVGPWTATEVPSQIRLDRLPNRAHGSVFFRARNGLLNNPKGFADSLRNDLYRNPALVPSMPWKEQTPPNQPSNLRYEPLVAGGTAGLLWDAPLPASDGEIASRYVVYRFSSPTYSQSDLDNPENMIGVTGETRYTPPVPPTGVTPYYAVSAVDRNQNEGAATTTLTVTPPAVPLLASPFNGDASQLSSVTMMWHSVPLTSNYELQLATDSLFQSGMVLDRQGLGDTALVAINLEPLTSYYWRVRATNAGGAGVYSSTWTFATGFPPAPVQATPANNATGIPIPVQFSWWNSPASQSYHVQVSTNVIFSPSVFDSSGITDTTVVVSNLLGQRTYYWHVRATNDVGPGPWSAVFTFRTGTGTAVDRLAHVAEGFFLEQNYPNPFNPVTTIRFSIPRSEFVRLCIYDMLGREIDRLVDGELPAGSYSVRFEPSSLSTGTYLYVLTAGEERLTGKMLFVK